MRVFVLGTGRCGTTTFWQSMCHLTNYTAGHESRSGEIGISRFDYPDQHIEADNRLSWFLPSLGHYYGSDPLYIHLLRDPEAVAASFVKRSDSGIMHAFRAGILLPEIPGDMDAARFYVETVTTNVRAFLADKPNQMTLWLEDVSSWFGELWDRIGARGDRAAAEAEFSVRHRASRN